MYERCTSMNYMCSHVAGKGDLSVLKMLCADGCPWNANTCASAAYGGHLDVLQWARVNGCPWNKAECLKWSRRDDTRAWIESGAGDYCQQALTKSAAPRACTNKSR